VWDVPARNSEDIESGNPPEFQGRERKGDGEGVES
jgi:hypothetical protein